MGWIFFVLSFGRVFAAESVFSGKISAEFGASQSPSDSLRAYLYERLFLQSQYDLSDDLSLNLAGEVNWQLSGSSLAPAWPLYSIPNRVDLEAENYLSSAGTDIFSGRLSRFYLKWASGRLEATAGLQDFNWGSAHFFKPTNFFFPLNPLNWTRDQPLGSEALDANCFLFDDLSLEGSVRWLEGGADEWVVRLIEKNVGFAVIPSFARLTGRDGMGLELSVTFPDFKVWVEGVDWIFPAGPAQWEWVIGASTIGEGATFVLEAYRDKIGSRLGAFSNGTTDGQKSFPGEWKAASAWVKALEGGPLLFWPQLSWGFSPAWELGFQGQIPVGNQPGPLAVFSSRVGVSLSYSF
jgi:hypothetical protein